MIRHSRTTHLQAACLSCLAGYVDAFGYLALGGFFVSFMSGNSTRLGIGIAHVSTQALVASSLIAGFVAGVVVGSLVGHFAASRRRAAVLATVAGLLALAGLFAALGARGVAIGLMTLAMGAENAVFERDGEVSIGLTYMTGTLVKAGQRICAALLGGDRLAWSPYLLLWAGLVAGGAIGTMIYPLTGLAGVWIAAVGVAALAIFARPAKTS